MSVTDIASDFDLRGALPRGAAMRALDSEIAGEGQKVIGMGEKIILSNGDMVAWTPPPEKLVIPDLSEVKSLRHYFGQRGYQVYPAWLYHPTKSPVLVKDSTESAKFGIVFRKTSDDERMRYGRNEVWDWEEGCLWRPNPQGEARFDPHHPGPGKTVVFGTPDARIAQNDMIAALIPAVAAAVAQSLKTTGPLAPAGMDPQQWDEFLAFKAWQKTREVVSEVAAQVEAEEAGAEPLSSDEVAANALSPEQDRFLWEAEAQRLNIKVDKRWGIERLREEVEKASAA